MLTLVTNKVDELNLNFDINQKHDLIPKSESIKKYIDSEINRILEESRMAEKDLEYTSFRPSTSFYLRGFFGGSPSYSSVGFTDFLLTGTNINTQQSYYIFDLFDNYIENNQQLISRNFVKFSKIVRDTSTNIYFDVSKKIVKEFVNIYVPTYFINEGVDTFYLKIFFFNSVNGKFRYFKCSDTDENATKFYLKLKLNLYNSTYDILNGDIISTQPNVYKISEVIEVKKEEENLNKNKIKKYLPIIKPNKIITTKGDFITYDSFIYKLT